MKKRLVTMLLLLLVAVMPMARAEERTEEELLELYEQARTRLEEAGITVTEQVIQEAVKTNQAYEKAIQEFLAGLDEEDRELYAGMNGTTSKPEELAYTLLINIGVGIYLPETWAWTPTSSQVYAFDAEVFNVSGMYTEFFQGVNAIVPGAPFTDITEDLSGMTEEMDWSAGPFWYGTDGTRSVSFRCNGQAYTVTLDSYGDWFNERMIAETNRILAKEGFPKRLQVVIDGADQIVALIYGTEEEAERVCRAIGMEEVPEMEVLPERLIEKLFPFLVG